MRCGIERVNEQEIKGISQWSHTCLLKVLHCYVMVITSREGGVAIKVTLRGHAGDD